MTEKPEKKPIRVLLLDDRYDNLILRTAILRSRGYEVVTSASVEEAEAHLVDIDIAVLDYHLGAGKFGTEVAQSLRDKRPAMRDTRSGSPMPSAGQPPGNLHSPGERHSSGAYANDSSTSAFSPFESFSVS